MSLISTVMQMLIHWVNNWFIQSSRKTKSCELAKGVVHKTFSYVCFFQPDNPLSVLLHASQKVLFMCSKG